MIIEQIGARYVALGPLLGFVTVLVIETLFGMFSAFRTTEDHLRETIQSEEFADYPIHYLYMTSGNFDFALLAQVRGYRMLVGMEPRLVYGVNTLFEVFPMRYHSMGNWHLALYNYLQKIFYVSWRNWREIP